MSTQVMTTSSGAPRSGGRRRGGGGGQGNQNRNRNKQSGGGPGGKAPATNNSNGARDVPTGPSAAQMAAEAAANEEDEGPVCWICAEPVKYYAVSECSHRTCHVCALRLRALYKKLDCTFCKEPQNTVIFTSSADTPFSSFTPESIPYKDSKLSIFFETHELMEESLVLLKFNCPDPDCDYVANGWGDLRLHARANHGKLMCELCTRHKKVFCHEHTLYPPNQLPNHVPSMYRPQNYRGVPKEQVEGGVHPLCEFCRECFFGEEELYKHMRENHEECFICKRNEIQHQYFQSYETLERHFYTAHFACKQPECLAHKFVVFNTQLDLQAHMVQEHGANMSSKDRRNAQRVEAPFSFEDTRRPPHRDRDPPPQRPPQQQQQQAPSGPTQIRQGGNARRREFGASLTTQGGAPPPPTPDEVREATEVARATAAPSTQRTEVDPATLERHTAFINRLTNFSTNPSHAIPAVKAAIRGYRGSESSARDLILTVWNVLDRNLEHTASIVNAFVDLLEEEEKKLDVLGSWRGFAIEQRRERQEDTMPNAVGSGYANIASGRVINAKHSTTSRSSQQHRVFDRVAQAASSSSAIAPPARAAARAADQGTSHALSSDRTQASGPRPVESALTMASGAWASRAGKPNTGASFGTAPGAARSTSSSAPTIAASSSFPSLAPSSTPASGSRTIVSKPPPYRKPVAGPPPPKLTSSAFPVLASTSSAPPKVKVSGNAALKHILGDKPLPASKWGSSQQDAVLTSGTGPGSGSGTSGLNSDIVDQGESYAIEGDADGEGTGEGNASSTNSPAAASRKKKGKQKQTLFTIGALPS